MVERGIARDNYPVTTESGDLIGIVTSGSPAPYLKTNIAYAYVPTHIAESKEDVFVQVRANKVRAKQVPTPLLQTPQEVRVDIEGYRQVRILRILSALRAESVARNLSPQATRSQPKAFRSSRTARRLVSVGKACSMENLEDVHQDFPGADGVGRFTVFNIKGNHFRLVVELNYRAGRMFIRHVLTHAEYTKGSWKS